MGDKKLAVIFPGFGYHCDKPLLYYGRKLALQKGYEILEVKYDIKDAYEAMKDDKDRDKKVLKMATDEAVKKFSEVNLSEYKDVVLIGKSFGTIVAGWCDKELSLNAKHIVFTPVPETFEHLRKGCGIVFHGTSDPLCENEIVREMCEELGLELIEVEGANHSLEIQKVDEDLRIMGKVMERVEREM
ncbi:MAG: hypothetical protein IKO76_07915 [Butyrivibrio sp.]|nr:hypothetical protein [Butyrivibrio sp.]